MAKKPRPPGKKYNFMDTYGDLVTLLMCFFVLLFAMSNVEEAKYNAFVEALTRQFGSAPENVSFVPESSPESGEDYYEETDPTGDSPPQDENMPADLASLEESINEYIQQNNMEGEITVEKSASGATFIRLSDNLLFDGDSSELRPEILAFLDFFSECLTAVESQILQVKFNGHTASVAGSGVDDWELAGNRAAKVSSYVNNIGGFSRFKIVPVFYGRNFPIADNGTAEGRAKNRRVDIIVLGNDTDNLEATLADAMRVYFPSDDTSFYEGEQSEIPTNAIEAIAPYGSVDEALSGMTEEEMDQLLDGMMGEEGGAASGSG